MEMTILEREDGITHVVLAGRLDTTGTEEIADRFSQATARERPAVIDLSAIEFLASRGIGLLVAHGKRLVKAGHKVVLLNPRGLVASVLTTSQVDRVLPIAYHLEEAIGILLGAAAQPFPPGPRPKPSADKSEPHASPSGPAGLSAIEGQLGLTIKNELSELKRLNAAIAQFLDTHRVPYRAAYAVNLAIDELVTNVLRYAYVDFDMHMIEIQLAVESDQVVLRIVDDGRPFDPRRGPMLDQHAEDRETGGLGLLLVLDMVDVLEYQREEEKNCVEVRIRMIAENGVVKSATTVAPESAVEER